MAHYKLALLGFGNVGQALAKLLLEKQEELEATYDLTFSITGIATGSHGAALDPGGIDIDRALTLIRNGNSLDGVSVDEPEREAANST